MNDFEMAKRDAADAAANSDQLAQIFALLQAQQLVQQQPPAPAPTLPPSNGSTAKWVAIGLGVGVGAPVFLIAFAMAAIATAITAVGLTICVLVLRAMWRDIKSK
ncbi:hypothetical protein [Streptomyces microflavus]|uniref:hypothetical protein n=1 Tax=Streptomyces microflavus TaxID=1919 RepID=UPI0033DAEF90